MQGSVVLFCAAFIGLLTAFQVYVEIAGFYAGRWSSCLLLLGDENQHAADDHSWS